MPATEAIADIESHGYYLHRGVFPQAAMGSIIAELSFSATPGGRISSANARNLIENYRGIAKLAASNTLRQLVEPVLGPSAFVVRGLLFDKVAGANWHVGWHQDLMIPIACRVETPGFTAWSEKGGIAHVRPPAEVLEGMLAVRIHLDDCPADNAPLEVLPGSHRRGIIDEPNVRQVASEYQPVTCTATAGDVLVMRPLLLHASRKSHAPMHRRVLHLEFAARPLPGELLWYEPIGIGSSRSDFDA